MKKIISIIKHCSCILFPLVTVALCVYLNKHVDYFHDFFNLDSSKLGILAVVSAFFIGMLWAFLICVTSFFGAFITPKIIEQYQKTTYRNIYESNIYVGLLIYEFSLVSYILFDNVALYSILFIGGLPNIFVTVYYTIRFVLYYNGKKRRMQQ